jgi:hypothetical protein
MRSNKEKKKPKQNKAPKRAEQTAGRSPFSRVADAEKLRRGGKR